MKPFPFALPLPAAALLLLSFTSGLRGQTAPATADLKKSEDVVRLSEFSVNAGGGDRGYVAAETMTGSRVATQIKDLPFTVNVLTSEFFDDFGMFELADNLVQIGGFTGLDIGGGFNLRGFSSTSQLRDGFLRLGRYGQSNVDRIEVIKGPSASGLYGRSSPGGMINMISKQPKKKESVELKYSFGSYDTSRAGLEMTGIAGSNPNTYYVLTLSQFNRDFDGFPARNRNTEGYLAVGHDFADGSHLMVSAEYFLQERRAPNALAPLIIDQKGTAATTDDVAVGYAKNLASYSAHGPHSQLDRGNTGFTATYEKRFNAVWSWRAAGNYYLARRWDFNQNNSWPTVNINTPAGTILATRGATPNRRLIFEDGGGFQSDVVAHTFLANRSIESKTLLTFEVNDYYRYDPTWNYAAATNPALVAWNLVRTVSLNSDFTPKAPIQYFAKDFDPTIATPNALFRQRTTVFGGLFRQQTIFFDGRLLTYAGARYDSAKFSGRDYSPTNLAAAVLVDNKKLDALKPNLGFNYKLIPSLRFYANYSESYFIDQTTKPVDIFNPDFKFETAKGYDYGFKGSYLNDRLNFTVGGYYINRYNVSVSDTFELVPGSGSFITQNRRDGDQLVRGWEADANWRVSDAVSFNGSFGNVNSKYTNFGSASPLAIGRSVNGVSPENGSLSVKYDAGRSGPWKGFSINLGVTYVSSTPSEAPNAGDTYATVAGKRVLTSTTRQWALRTPSFTLWNLGLHYRVSSSPRFAHTLDLNVNNLFDLSYLKVKRELGDSRGIYFTYRVTATGLFH